MNKKIIVLGFGADVSVEGLIAAFGHSTKDSATATTQQLKKMSQAGVNDAKACQELCEVLKELEADKYHAEFESQPTTSRKHKKKFNNRTTFF